MAGAEAALGVDDDAHRMRAAAAPHGEQGVVVADGAGAHDDRVGERAHAMGMDEVGLAGDPARGAGGGGDAAVEALAEMGDGKAPSPRHLREGQIELQQRRGLRQLLAALHRRRAAAMALRQQALPGAAVIPHADPPPPSLGHREAPVSSQERWR